MGGVGYRHETAQERVGRRCCLRSTKTIASSSRWRRRTTGCTISRCRMLLLHGLMTGRTDRLIHWLNICPHKQFTTLDTHDGIGVVDVVGLLTDDEIDYVREKVDEITEPAKPYLKYPGIMIKTSKKQAQRYQLGMHLLFSAQLR